MRSFIRFPGVAWLVPVALTCGCCINLRTGTIAIVFGGAELTIEVGQKASLPVEVLLGGGSVLSFPEPIAVMIDTPDERPVSTTRSVRGRSPRA